MPYRAERSTGFASPGRLTDSTADKGEEERGVFGHLGWYLIFYSVVSLAPTCGRKSLGEPYRATQPLFKEERISPVHDTMPAIDASRTKTKDNHVTADDDALTVAQHQHTEPRPLMRRTVVLTSRLERIDLCRRAPLWRRRTSSRADCSIAIVSQESFLLVLILLLFLLLATSSPTGK